MKRRPARNDLSAVVFGAFLLAFALWGDLLL